MQIDYSRIKPFMEWEKQRRCINNLHLYYGEPCHVVCKCPNKHGPHVAHAISITNPQPKELKNEHVQFQ
jgi:hypothetical protein